MSLRGRLDDVALTDVMQFIHLGRRTGTLRLERGDERAEINFHRGAILGAWTPHSKKLGELLLEAGLISEAELAAAIEEHESTLPRRSFGQVLLATTPLPVDEVRSAVKRQIEETVFELVGWAHGSFSFELDALEPIDGVSVSPAELVPNLDLNTQMVLLEAARVFDERNRRDGDETEPVAAADRAAAEGDSLEQGIASLGMAGAPAKATVAPLLHLISPDRSFLQELAEVLQASELQLTHHLSLTSLPESDGRTPILVFDLRSPSSRIDELGRLVARFPHATVVAIVPDPAATGSSQDGALSAAYGAGATAVVPWGVPEAVRGCLARIASLQHPAPPSAPPAPSRHGDPSAIARSGFAKLRRVVSDLRSGVFSATVALNLMNIVAESVERAVLFLVRGDELVALGAFGFSRDRRPLAETTRALKLSATGDSALARAIEQGHALSAPFDQAALPRELSELLGRPRSGQVAIFPVMGTDRVILVIYTDNGDINRPIEEIDILDLVAAEVGIAFENEMLRQQLARNR